MSSFVQEVSTLESWVMVRADRSLQPSRYMNLYELALRDLMDGHRIDEELWDVTDAVRAAAEIEALCAHRSLVLYRRQQERSEFDALIREVTAPRPWEPKRDARRTRKRGADGRYLVEKSA